MTYEAAASPSAGDFDWRISIASVAAGGPFSAFPGIDRTIMLLEGTGLVLDVDGVEHELAPSVPFAFSGDATTSARLAAGPTWDFNVMARRGRWSATVDIREPGAPPSTIEPAPGGETVVVGLAGESDVTAGGRTVSLQRWDAVRASGPIEIAGPGTCVVVGLEPLVAHLA